MGPVTKLDQRNMVNLYQTRSNEYGGWVVGLVAKFSTTVVLVPCTVGYRTYNLEMIQSGSGGWVGPVIELSTLYKVLP